MFYSVDKSDISKVKLTFRMIVQFHFRKAKEKRKKKEELFGFYILGNN